MKRFVFPLASLLNAKRLMEKDARKSLSEAERRLQLLIDERTALERAFALDSEDRRRKVLAGAGPLTLLQYDSHFLALRERIAAHEKAIAVAGQERDRCQDALRLIHGEIKALELLREQQWTAWLAAAEQEQAREVDEIVAFRQFLALEQGGAR